MRLQDLRIRALDGSVLVDGQFALHGDPAVLAHFAIPELVGVAVKLSPHLSSNWKFTGYSRVEQGSDGLWGASAPAVTLDLGTCVPSLVSLANTTYLPAEPVGFSLNRKGRVRMGSFNVPMASPQPDKAPSAYLQFDAIDLTLDPVPEGLRIALTARVVEMIGPIEGLNVAGLVVTGEVLVPDLALQLQGLPRLLGRSEDPVVGKLADTRLETDDLGLERYGGLVLEGQVDWGQNGDLNNPLGPFVSAYLGDHEMGFSPTARASRHASGLLDVHRPSTDGPYMRIDLGLKDFARLLEVEDQVELSLHGAGLGHIVGRTGRDAYEYGNLRQDLVWLTLKLQRSAAGLLVGGQGEFAPGANGESPRVGKSLDFAFFLPRKRILARGMPIPRCWDDWKRDLPDRSVW